MAEHAIGIEEGTMGVSAVVLRPDGGVAGVAYEEIGQSFPHPGWVEHDAGEIWQATRLVTSRALAAARLRMDDVAAVGIANQRGSAIAWDDRGHALGPVVSWQDQRTAARCAELAGEGLVASTLVSSTKWEWLLREHASDRDARDRRGLRLGTVDSWLANRLSGGSLHATDASNASCTGLYEWARGGWDARAAERLGLDVAWLPKIESTSGVVGETSAEEVGARVPIAALAGDQQAAMAGLACIEPGSVKLTLGTSGMMDANVGGALAPPGAGTYPLVLWSIDGARSFCFEGTTITAGAAAQWLRDGLGVVDSLDEIEPLARSVDSSAGAWIVPAFQGLGTPWLDPGARALAGGLSRATTRAHLVRALLEGIAWRCRDVFDALSAHLPSRPSLLRVDGGAARNRLLLELLADALGIAVEAPAMLDSAAAGAALLAGRAVGLWRDGDVLARWKPSLRVEPVRSEDERETEREKWAHRVALAREAGS
ncbi:MAG: FGGY family carbohydrate kinase [Alphaproteobacteria bacterium]